MNVRVAARLEDFAWHATIDAVKQARAQRISWQQISEALGVTRQAATQRFSKLVPDYG